MTAPERACTVVTTAPWAFAMIPQQVEVAGFHDLDIVCHKMLRSVEQLLWNTHIRTYIQAKIKVLLAATYNQKNGSVYLASVLISINS